MTIEYKNHRYNHRDEKRKNIKTISAKLFNLLVKTKNKYFNNE